MLKRLLLVFYVLTLFVFVAPPQAHAQEWGGCVQYITDPDTGKTSQIATLQCLPVVFSNVIRGALMFVGTVAVILIIYAGIRFVTSGGDPKQVQGARQIITYAIIGLVLVLSSFAIIYFISYLTGAKCIETMSLTGCQ